MFIFHIKNKLSVIHELFRFTLCFFHTIRERLFRLSLKTYKNIFITINTTILDPLSPKFSKTFYKNKET